MEKGVPWDVELIIIIAKGHERWVRTKGDVEFVDGKPIALFGTFQDISDHIESVQLIKKQIQDLKANAEEVDRLNAGQNTLYFKNRYRTKSGEWRWLSWVGQEDTSSGKIYAAARDITIDYELAEIEKKNFHEIRTPMNGIVGLIDLLLSNTDPNPLQMEYL